MNQFLKFVKLDVLLLHRNKLFYVGIVVTLMYIGIFYLFSGLEIDTSLILIIILFNDPVVTGYLFAGILWLFDVNQNTMSVLSVLPVPVHYYFLSKIVVLSVYAVVMSLVMVVTIHGLNFNPIHLFTGVFLSAFMFSAAGFWVVSYAGNFNQFLLYSLPIFIFSAVPFLGIAGIGSIFYYCLVPIWGGVGLIKASLMDEPAIYIILYYFHCIGYTLALWLLFRKRINSIQI